MAAIIRCNPWSLISGLQDEMNQVFDRNTSEKGELRKSFAVDIREMKDHYLITADLPGLSAQDIHITIESNMLTIQGDRKSDKKQGENGYTRIERFAGTFYRQFTLPDDIDVNKIDATSREGVLELRLPKIEISQPKKIEVKVV